MLSKETMEKLTWLATERRLSQEGDSEEENSQEENSEPEEEEEEEGEGIESLPKDDEICGDTSEEPKSAFTMAKAASPQVEAHRMPAGECCGGFWVPAGECCEGFWMPAGEFFFFVHREWGIRAALCREKTVGILSGFNFTGVSEPSGAFQLETQLQDPVTALLHVSQGSLVPQKFADRFMVCVS